MTFKPGDQVERLRGSGENRFGRITDRVGDSLDDWYVTVRFGPTYVDHGNDLRLVDDQDEFRPDPSTIG